MLAHRNNTGGLIGGVILIALGLLFLLAQFFNFQAFGWLWPLGVIGIGALFFVGMLAGGKSTAALAIPGSIIGVVGLMLLIQSFTGYWSSWAYGWTVILMAVGLGLWISGLWSDNPRQRHAGVRVMEIGLILFVVFGAFFELLIFGVVGMGLRQAFFPVLLILLGLYLIVRRSGLLPGSGPRGNNPPPLDQPK